MTPAWPGPDQDPAQRITRGIIQGITQRITKGSGTGASLVRSQTDFTRV